jgi:hypothetical protein
MGSKKLLETLFDEEDLACDYIETEVGANDFQVNWANMKKYYDPVDMVEEWLKSTGVVDADPNKIVEIIDKYAADKSNWLTPFNRRVEN